MHNNKHDNYAEKRREEVELLLAYYRKQFIHQSERIAELLDYIAELEAGTQNALQKTEDKTGLP